MNVAFVSNYLNHHQTYLCNHIKNQCDSFYFIATGRIPEEIIQFGYEDLNSKYDYVIKAYESKVDMELAYVIIKESDIVIFGSCESNLIKIRMDENKLSFIYSERFFKRGLWSRYVPKIRDNIYNRVLKYQRNNLYLLCASAFTSYDLLLMGYYKKCYKWGYFPEVKHYDFNTLYGKKKHKKIKLLWVGRLIYVKRPHHAIKLAINLKRDGYDFELIIIGTGYMEHDMKRMVERNNLQKEVTFLGSMSPDKVREYMEEANIFLFTSSYGEGWGAVLNEAMNSGCSVVASHAIGSVPFLIKHKENGLIYTFGNHKDFLKKVKLLIHNPSLRYKYGIRAYKTIANEWNGELAAERFIQLAQSILIRKPHIYMEGPCSKAKIIKNKWFKNYDK